MTTAAPEERRRRYVRPGASILAAVVVTAALVATQTVADLVNVFLLNGRFWILDASSESGLGARVSAGAIAAAALLVGLRAIVDRDRRVLNALIAVALGFLALDDTVGLHERLIQALTRLLSTPRAVDDWPTAVVYAPLLLFVAVAVWRDSIRGTARLLARAGIVVLGTALGLRVLGAAIMLEGGYSPRLRCGPSRQRRSRDSSLEASSCLRSPSTPRCGSVRCSGFQVLLRLSGAE